MSCGSKATAERSEEDLVEGKQANQRCRRIAVVVALCRRLLRWYFKPNTPNIRQFLGIASSIFGRAMRESGESTLRAILLRYPALRLNCCDNTKYACQATFAAQRPADGGDRLRATSSSYISAPPTAFCLKISAFRSVVCPNETGVLAAFAMLHYGFLLVITPSLSILVVSVLL
jgi:hypothetical protein